jgi:hypothetical protein
MAVNEVMNQALHAALVRRERLVLVDSPPGAGKTWFCERLVAYAIGHAGLRVCYVAPKVDQGADMARRLVASRASFDLEVLTGKGRTRPTDIDPTVLWTSDATSVGAAGALLITNPQKLAHSRDALGAQPFDVLLVDEAYQLSARDFLPIAHLAPIVVMVGDPGQLAPTIMIDTSEFETDGARMHWPAPREVLRNYPDTPVFKIPASRRLVHDTVRLVQPMFYPDLEFVSAAEDEDRRLRFAAAGLRDAIDQALDAIAAGKSVVAITIPGEPPAADDRDPVVAEICARIVQRVQQRGGRWDGRSVLGERDMGIVDAHVVSGNGIRAELQRQGNPNVRVETPELWQGQEMPLMLVKHPLSIGAAAPGEFHLDPGRFCVMLSRHLLGCIIVARESVGATLRDYLHDASKCPIGARDEAWHGFKAHSSVWGALEADDRIFRLT